MKKKDEGMQIPEIKALWEDWDRWERRFSGEGRRNGDLPGGRFWPFKTEDGDEVAILWIQIVAPKLLTEELLDVLREGMRPVKSKVREVIERDFGAVTTR